MMYSLLFMLLLLTLPYGNHVGLCRRDAFAGDTVPPLHPYTCPPLHPCTIAPLQPCTHTPLRPIPPYTLASQLAYTRAALIVYDLHPIAYASVR